MSAYQENVEYAESDKPEFFTLRGLEIAQEMMSQNMCRKRC